MLPTIVCDQIMQYDPTNRSSTLDFLLPLNGTDPEYSARLNGTLQDPGPLEEQPDQELTSLLQQLQQTRFVCQRILVPIIVTIGVVGNLMNIVVLTRRWMRSSTNYYLTALAICDVLYLVLAFTQSFKHYEQIRSQDWFIHYRAPFGMPLTDIFSNTGVWLTLTFTIERYIGVCHPMKGKRWCTPLRARYVIIMVSLCAAVITFPEFFATVVKVVVDPSTNRTELKAKETRFAEAHAYRFGYVYMNQALFTILPLVLLFAFNSLLINAVLHAAKQRRAMSNLTVVRNERSERHNREQQKITIMLISVVIVFLVCQLPQAITNLYFSYVSATVDSPDKKLMCRLTINNNVCNILVMVNASINFILYSSFSTKFRGTFRRVFCKCLGRKDANQLFTEFVSMSGHGHHAAGDKKYSISYSTAGRSTSISTGSSGKPLLKNGNTDALLKREYSGGNVLSAPPAPTSTPRKKNGYLEVDQDNSDNNVENTASSL